jgi:hypothetical protein
MAHSTDFQNQFRVRLNEALPDVSPGTSGRQSVSGLPQDYVLVNLTNIIDALIDTVDELAGVIDRQNAS